jgi:hypothetical protein
MNIMGLGDPVGFESSEEGRASQRKLASLSTVLSGSAMARLSPAMRRRGSAISGAAPRKRASGLTRGRLAEELVSSNHDRPRIAARVGQEQARVGAMLLLTLRGTPMLYYGDEHGIGHIEIAPNLVRDPWAKREPGIGVRAGSRTNSDAVGRE